MNKIDFIVDIIVDIIALSSFIAGLGFIYKSSLIINKITLLLSKKTGINIEIKNTRKKIEKNIQEEKENTFNKIKTHRNTYNKEKKEIIKKIRDDLSKILKKLRLKNILKKNTKLSKEDFKIILENINKYKEVISKDKNFQDKIKNTLQKIKNQEKRSINLLKSKKKQVSDQISKYQLDIKNNNKIINEQIKKIKELELLEKMLSESEKKESKLVKNIMENEIFKQGKHEEINKLMIEKLNIHKHFSNMENHLLEKLRLYSSPIEKGISKLIKIDITDYSLYIANLKNEINQSNDNKEKVLKKKKAFLDLEIEIALNESKKAKFNSKLKDIENELNISKDTNKKENLIHLKDELINKVSFYNDKIKINFIDLEMMALNQYKNKSSLFHNFIKPFYNNESTIKQLGKNIHQQINYSDKFVSQVINNKIIEKQLQKAQILNKESKQLEKKLELEKIKTNNIVISNLKENLSKKEKIFLDLISLKNNSNNFQKFSFENAEKIKTPIKKIDYFQMVGNKVNEYNLKIEKQELKLKKELIKETIEEILGENNELDKPELIKLKFLSKLKIDKELKSFKLKAEIDKLEEKKYKELKNIKDIESKQLEIEFNSKINILKDKKEIVNTEYSIEINSIEKEIKDIEFKRKQENLKNYKDLLRTEIEKENPCEEKIKEYKKNIYLCSEDFLDYDDLQLEMDQNKLNIKKINTKISILTEQRLIQEKKVRSLKRKLQENISYKIKLQTESRRLNEETTIVNSYTKKINSAIDNLGSSILTNNNFLNQNNSNDFLDIINSDIFDF